MLLRQFARPLANIRVLRRIPEYLQTRYASDDTVFTVNDFDGSLKFQSKLSSHIGSHIFWKGCYARTVLALLDRLLVQPDQVFIDVGANEGEETIFAAKRLTHGHVYAFEPNDNVYSRLCQNVALNHFANVCPLKMGLDSKPGKLTLYGPGSRDKDGTWNDGQGTVCPRPGVDRPIGEIELTTLDLFRSERKLPRVDLIKVDVEGAELTVLQGGDQLLDECRPKLIVETWEDSEQTLLLLEHIRRKAYSIFNLGENGSLAAASDLRHTSRDVFCIPQSSTG